MASYRSFRGSKGTLGPCRAVCLWRVGLESCWGPAVSHPYGSFSCRFCGFQEGAFSMATVRVRRFRLRSVSSRPYGSFSCRFCGFQEGAFSMASYRSFRGSKGTLGPCRAVCLWRVGLESCWGSAVSHPYGSFSCRFCGFQEGAFSMASYRSFSVFCVQRGLFNDLCRTMGPKFFVFGLLVSRLSDRCAASAFGGFQ